MISPHTNVAIAAEHHTHGFRLPRFHVAAAVSIPKPLYQQALVAAEAEAEGNFSLYVRNLIRIDLRSRAS